MDEDEIDDLDDIRKIMQETQRVTYSQSYPSTYTEPTSTDIVPFNPDILEKNTALQRPAIETNFRQPTTIPTFSSAGPAPHYQQSSSTASGGFTTDISGRPFTTTTSHYSSFYNRNEDHQQRLNSSSQQQKNDQQTGQHTFSAPSSLSMPESIFNSQTRTRPSTFSSDISASNPISNSLFSSTTSSLSSSVGAAGPLFPKKTSRSDFKSLTRNSNSYYNRQPNSVFSSTNSSSNPNSDYRFRPVEVPNTQFSQPYFPDDHQNQKQTETANSVTAQFPRTIQSDNNDTSNNATTNSYVPTPDALSGIDEQNPTLLGLRDAPPRPHTRPHSRPQTLPPKQSKHMSDEIRRSSEKPSSNEKTFNNSLDHHSSRPNHRDHSSDHIATSNDRQLTYSPLPPISTSRSKSPVSRFNLSTAINPKMDARPLGLQVKASSNTAATNKMDKTGKIPKKSFDKQRDDITSMSMLQLLSKKKEITYSLSNLNENRQNLERKKSDIERSSRGSYYDNDPQHRHLKDQLAGVSAKERELKAQLNSIWDRLEGQFNLKRTSDPIDRQSSKPDQTKRSRPKMSTTPSGPPVELPNRLEREQQLSNAQLNLEDGNNWCQICDVHLKSLKEYCMHIHSEVHSEKVKNKTRPWSKVTTEFLTKGQTLDVINKVLKTEAERKEANLSIDEFKAIFDPAKYKSTKKQDKAETSENSEDPNEKVDKPEIDIYRGQRFLIPTVGAYCTLCDRGFFDESDVEHHMRSYEHTVAHTRMVFIDPHIESNYHRDMNRSLERLKANKNSSDRSRYQENLQGLLEARERRERDKRRRIINDDEPKRLQKSRMASPKSRKRANIETYESHESSASESPIKKKQSTTQNRVTGNSIKRTSRELELSDSDDDTALSQSIMQHNDPDSLFPGLDLEVHGNSHTALLRDKKLSQQTVVVMEKLDITDPTYARLLSSENELNRLDSSATLFNTIVKAEPFDWTLAQATYFDKLGDQIPITLDSDNEDNSNIFDALVKQEKPDKPSKKGASPIIKEEGAKRKSPSEQNSQRTDVTNVKTEKLAPTRTAQPEVIKLFSDDEEDLDSKMIDIDSNLLSSCTDSEETNNTLPNFNLSNTLTSKSMEFTSTIPEKNPEGTLNSIAINNDSSNDNLGGIIFDTKSEASSPTARSSSPPLDNIIISNHSPSSNLIIPTTVGDTSIEDQSISVSMVQPTTSTQTTHATYALSSFETTTNSMPLTMTSNYSTPSCGTTEIDQHVPTKIEDMDCASNSLNFSHENPMVDSVDVDDVDLGNNFQTPNLSDLSDPLVNTFTGDPHLNSL